MTTATSSASRVPLSVLDLSPVVSGGTAGEALAASLELARRAEAAGYSRYWLAEHHLNPGVAGSAPHVLAASIAAATTRIRVGTAATILGNYEPIQVAEAAGTVAALHGGRFDLGLGRSGIPSASAPGGDAGASPRAQTRIVDGLVIPAPPPVVFDAERFAFQSRLLGRTPGDADRFRESVMEILAFFSGDYRAPEGLPVHVVPAEGAAVQLWVHGSTAGPSARIAGELGLRFGANYHVLPSAVLDSVAEYRAHFVPSEDLARAHVIVSTDVVVAETDEEAARLAAGYGAWVSSIRQGAGAIPYPSPDEAQEIVLDSEQEAAIRDRLETRFVGAPGTVAERLETLQRVTGADELLVTTITHDPQARARSYELLAREWGIGE